MPSVSKKQHNFMEAVAHNPSFAKKAGVPQSVGKHFSSADKGKTFKRGGDMAKANPFMEMIAKKKAAAAGKKPMKKMAGGGKTLSISPDMDVSDDKDEYKRSMRNQRAKDIGLAGVAGALSGAKLGVLGLDYMGRRNAEKKDSVKENQKEYGMKKGGMMKKMASGGMTAMGKVKTAAPSKDGVATKGKTKGKQVVMAGNKKMKSGGYC